MISTALRQDFTDLEGQMPELTGLSIGQNAASAAAQISSEITRESNKTVQTGHLELQVKYYCNGQLQKSTVTVLETYHKNIKGRETIRKMLQAKATLESQGVNGDLILRSKKGVPLVTIKAKEAVEGAKKTEIFSPNIQPQKLAEILAKSDAKAVIIQSKPQLKEIKKFAERLGIEKMIVPEKMLNEIEHDPRIVSLPRLQAIKIAEIAQVQQTRESIFELPNKNDTDIFAELSMPKVTVQVQRLTKDDPGFDQYVVGKILGDLLDEKEIARKDKTPFRKPAIQLINSAIRIQQDLASRYLDTSSEPTKIKFQERDLPAKRDLASLYRNLSANRKQAA